MSDDFSEIGRLEADMRKVPPTANRLVEKSLKRTSLRLVEDWKQGAEISDGYADSYAASISFDIHFPGGTIESEIGPVLGRTPGASAGFLDDPQNAGGVDGPVHHAGRDALEANEPEFFEGLELAAFEAIADELGA